MGRLDGQVADITGAASGMGKGLASRLGAEGARVVMADLDEAGLAVEGEEAARLTELIAAGVVAAAPLGRSGEPAHNAGVPVWLSPGDSSDVKGQTIVGDGGLPTDTRFGVTTGVSRLRPTRP